MALLRSPLLLAALSLLIGCWCSDEDELLASLRLEVNRRVAKNILLFIGDGMGPNTATAGRIFKGGEEASLAWEHFPYLALVKTYSADRQVPDSASTATSIFSGVKNNFETLGVLEAVKRGNCEASLEPAHRSVSLASLAQAAGKLTGFVTNTRVTDATPAALYAHSAHREWECDTSLPAEARACKDISRQLFEDQPGRSFNVVMGGGRQTLSGEVSSSPSDPVDPLSCHRSDGLDLLNTWTEGKANISHAIVNNTSSLRATDLEAIDYLLGIFGNSHLPYDYLRPEEVPSLAEMTQAALRLLAKGPNGFFLMVEGGLIDKAHHNGTAKVALHEVLALDQAVSAAMEQLDHLGLREETMVVVTSDHSHTLSISGYPVRGSSILGLADKSLEDGMAYTTLSYANSKKENFHFKAVEGVVTRDDPSGEDTTSFDYHHIAPVVVDINSHGGSDVFVWATGPGAYLFTGLHENTYIAKALSYSARLGEYSTTLGSGAPLPTICCLLTITALFVQLLS